MGVDSSQVAAFAGAQCMHNTQQTAQSSCAHTKHSEHSTQTMRIHTTCTHPRAQTCAHAPAQLGKVLKRNVASCCVVLNSPSACVPLDRLVCLPLPVQHGSGGARRSHHLYDVHPGPRVWLEMSKRVPSWAHAYVWSILNFQCRSCNASDS